MFPHRFREELSRLPLFSPATSDRISMEHVPAWRSVFTALALYGHAEGYRLFSFARFWNQIEKAFNRDAFARFFVEPKRKEFEERVRVWYESGMNETYLYSCLVYALEDKASCGVVLYDARADWKLKADIVAVVNGVPMRIDIFRGSAESRVLTVERRDANEREAKANTSESSHWTNDEMPRWKTLQAIFDPTACRTVNGVRLFSDVAVNALLLEIYTHAKVDAAKRAVL